MTLDEHRKKCIEAMAVSIEENMKSLVDPSMDTFHYGGDRQHWLDAAADAFDSLNGIALVVPIEATEAMLLSASELDENSQQNARRVWFIQTASADLTNPPENKP